MKMMEKHPNKDLLTTSKYILDVITHLNTKYLFNKMSKLLYFEGILYT